MTTNRFITFCLFIACICLGAAAPAQNTWTNRDEIQRLESLNSSMERDNERFQQYLDKYVDGIAKAVKLSGVKKVPQEVENWDLPVFLVKELKKHG